MESPSTYQNNSFSFEGMQTSNVDVGEHPVESIMQCWIRCRKIYYIDTITKPICILRDIHQRAYTASERIQIHS